REPSRVVPFAASELQRYLARMSGATVPVLPGVFERSPSRAITATLVLLKGRAAREVPRHGASVSLDERWSAELSGSVGDPADDAFAAHVGDGDKLVLAAAGSRSLLYATHDFLVRRGVRFFSPGFGTYQGHAEDVPKRPITIPPYRTAHHAGLRSRVKDLDEGLSVSAATLGPLVDWMGKARMNVLAIPHDLALGHISSYDAWRSLLLPLIAERGIVVEVGQHGYENWLPRSRYPQYYRSDYTVFDIADDEAVGAYIRAVIDYLSQPPHIT